MNALRSLLRSVLLSSSLALVACGGGGGENPPPPDATPPTVLSTVPANNATGVARNTTYVITFSEPIADGSVSSSTITWMQGAAAVPYTKAVAGAVVTLTPNGTLASDALHTVTVTTGVTDLSANPIAAAASFGFRTLDDVAPAIVSTNPVDAATGVSRNPTITVTFSEPVAAATATSANFELSSDGFATTVACNVTPSGATVTMTPTAQLANETAYQFRVKTGVTDVAGNPLAAQATFAFTTADTVAPTIATTDPVDGAVGVARNKAVVITFSEPIADGSVSSSTITWMQGAAAVPYTKAVAGAVVTLTPNGTLASDALHTVTVTTGVTDLSANPIAAAASFGFRTLDDVAPAIVSTNPVDAATGVSRNPTITVTFSEPVAAATATSANFELSSDGFATTVACNVTPSGATVTMTPTAQLANETAYQFRVKTGVTDVAGNPLAAQATFAFTTADTVAPTLLSTVPANNATGVSRSSTYAITFSEPILASSVTPTTLLWKQGASTVTYAKSVAGATVTLTASSLPLANGAAFTVEVTTGVTDLAGNGLQTAVTNSFMTIDDEPPAFVSSAPVDAATGVARDGNVVLTFSEPVAASSITPANVVWTDGATPVTWTPTVVGKTATLRPSAPLSNYALQSVRVTTGVTDLAGNHLPAEVDLGFRTADTVPPVFLAVPAGPAWADPASPIAFDFTADDSGSGLAATYRVRIARDALGATAVEVTPVGGSPASVSPSDLALLGTFADGDTIYAQVLAADVAGNETWSDWSLLPVRTDSNAPPVPAAPTDPGVRQSGRTVAFLWSPVIDAGSGVRDYTIEFSTASDCTAPLAATTTDATTASYTYPGGLPATIYAHVMATDNLGHPSAFGGCSDGIAVGATLAGTPNPPSDDGTYWSSSSLNFSWGVPPTGPIPDSYALMLGTTPGGSDITGPTGITGLTGFTTSYDVGAGRQGQTIYARVAAVYMGVQGGWSEPSDGITVDLTPPGLPGIPQPRGATDNLSVTFAWPPAVDAQSGIAGYEIEVFDGAASLGTFATTAPTYVYGASPSLVGHTLTAMVRAQNGALTWGDWTAPSSGVLVETTPPWVTMRSPDDGWTQVGRNVDLRLAFSEAMDRASVEAALTVTWSGGSPKHGLAFFWDASSTRVTVMPDAADPAGITNVDLLPGAKAITVNLGTGATDAAGNPMTSPYSFSFTTSDETPPNVASVTVGGAPSPFPAASVSGGFTLVVTFDADMSSTSGGIRLETREGGIEQRYSDWSAGVIGATPAGGQVTYKVSGTPDIRVGDRITVQGCDPSSFDVARAPVLAVGDDGSGNRTFAVALSPTGSWTSGGWVYYPNHGDAAIAWTGPRTLELTLPSYVRLAPGSEARVSVSNARDLDGDYMWAGLVAQVRPLPGTDGSPPFLASAAPAAGATGATRSSPVILRFNEPLDASSLDGSYAVDASGNPWDLNYSSDEMGPILLFVPRAAPRGGTRVDVHVPGTVRDLAGNLLGSPIDFSFDVAPRTDFDAPVLFETLPAAATPVDEIWEASAVFADGGTGRLELLDARSAGDEDLLVVDLGSGLPVRGYRARVDSGSGVLSLQPPPRGPGLSTEQRNQGISGATASSFVATYTTWNDHGLSAGKTVGVFGMVPNCFDASNAVVQSVTARTFTLASTCGDGPSTVSGWVQWQDPRSYEITLAVPPAQGGTGITDFEGNPMATASFTVLLAPPGTNRYPRVESLRDVRLSPSTSPAAHQLSASFRVRDADQDTVAVSITAFGGTLPLAGPTPVDTASGGDYRLSDGGGPPLTDTPASFNDGNFPTSGYYPFEITLDDGNGGVATYVREAWVWARADVPANVSVDDGGTVRPVSASRPVVVENTATPILSWSGVDTGNADFAVLQYLELNALSVGGNGGGPQGLPLPATATGVALPTPLEPTLYAWFIDQLKFSPGETSPESQGWSLDLGAFYEATVVYGPENRAFDGRGYGAVRTSFATRPAAVPAGWSAGGTYDVEVATGGAAAVFVDEALTRNDGTAYTTPASGRELFAADASGRFMVTTTLGGGGMVLPLADRGFVTSGGRFFALAGQDSTSISLQVGVWRDPAITFGANLDGTTFGFVQLQTRMGAGLVLQETESSVGQAVAGLTTLAVTGTRHDGTALDTGGPVPYTLGAGGLMTLDVGSPVAGYLGGASGALAGALTQQGNAGDTFTLIVIQKHLGPWPADPLSLLQGTYRFVEYTPGTDGAGGVGENHSAVGTMAFDGAGGFTYQVTSAGQVMAGYGTYSVDPSTGTVSAQADPLTNPIDFLLQIGVGADLLVGSSVGVARANTPQVLILGR